MERENDEDNDLDADSDLVFVWHSASNTWVKQNFEDDSFDDLEYERCYINKHNVYQYVFIEPADFTTMLFNMPTEQLFSALCHNCNDATYDAIDELSTEPDLLQLQQAMLKRFEDPSELLYNLTSSVIECLMSNVNYITDKAFHKCQSTFWIKIPLWSRHARRWGDLLHDTPSTAEESDEEPNEDGQEENNDVQDHGDASSEVSFDSGVTHDVQHPSHGGL